MTRVRLLLVAAVLAGSGCSGLPEVVDAEGGWNEVSEWHGLAAFYCCSSGTYPPQPDATIRMLVVDLDGRVLSVNYHRSDGGLAFDHAGDSKWKGVLELVLAEAPWLVSDGRGIVVESAEGRAMAASNGREVVEALRSASAQAREPTQNPEGHVFDGGFTFYWAFGKSVSWEHYNDVDPGWERVRDQLKEVRAWFDAAPA